tara:strand:- start:1823 stop:1960 length:138 start_codon:yes stop_codon:yes gene_type:complete
MFKKDFFFLIYQISQITTPNTLLSHTDFNSPTITAQMLLFIKQYL